MYYVHGVRNHNVREIRTEPEGLDGKGRYSSGFFVGEAYRDEDAKLFAVAPQMLTVLRELQRWIDDGAQAIYFDTLIDNPADLSDAIPLRMAVAQCLATVREFEPLR